MTSTVDCRAPGGGPFDDPLPLNGSASDPAPDFPRLVAAAGLRPERALVLARERDALERFVGAARDGRGQVLVIRGETGLGKTTLLEHVITSASGFRAATVCGLESERDLSYAGLQRLCVTMMDHVDALPGPQRDALAAAFGERPGTIDRFLVGLAVLGLINEVSVREPVVCVIDDAQWLDDTSMQVLAFVARRLQTERVALVCAVREPMEALEGLPELVLRGLSHSEAHALLASIFPGPLHERIRDRVVAEARGNVRALFALPYGMMPDQLAGGFGMPAAPPAGDRDAATLRARIDGLPVHTRRLLLVAAAEPEGDPALLWRAAARLGIEPGAADEAESLELLEFGPRVVFRHPSMRSALYHDARFDERRRVHQALADSIDPDTDPDRWAWHRAQATLFPDEDVADTLERSASHAQTQGGFAAAAAFLERSALLTPESDRRAQRALAAAHAKYEAGSLEAASELLTVAADGSFDELERARMERLRAKIAFDRSRGSDAAPLLLRAAKALEPLDVQLARDTYLQAIEAALFAGRLGASCCGLVETAKAARAAPPATAPCAADLLLDGLAILFTDGYSDAAPTLGRALQAFLREDDTRWLGLASCVAGELWDGYAALKLVSRWIQLLRETGALTQLPIALNYLAAVHLHTGEFDYAAGIIDDANAISVATGRARLAYGPMALAAWRGAEARTAELMEASRQDALERGDGRQISHIEYTSAVLYNGLGRYRDALTAVRQGWDREELFSCAVLPELVEAAARSNERELAVLAVERLVERTEVGGTEWALAIQARSVALVTEGPAAEKLYREAIERLGRCPTSTDLARAHLVYGEWLRRERRRVDAREQLRIAHDMLSTMGADAFAARAHRELLATGERSRKRTVETTLDLTPQEAEIARLARAGQSNPQIAGKLFISARTVEYHLHKVFTKLDISSRSELAYRLDVEDEPSSSAS
jgi:DNA-binding CsgD family transcriptional regulator